MPARKPSKSAPQDVALAPSPKKKHAPPPPPAGPHAQEHPGPGKKHPKPKKEDTKHEDKPGGKHLRRAYEHLGRIDALQLGKAAPAQIALLVHLAQHSLEQGDAHLAADLLRAGEHLGFATLSAQPSASPDVTPALEQAIRREFRKLLENAEEHEQPKASDLGQLLRQTIEDARAAFDRSNFRQALELARAAEALAGLDAKDLAALAAPNRKRALKP